MSIARSLVAVAVIAMVTGAVSGCSSSSSSTASSAPSAPDSSATSAGTTTSGSLELRPVYARYASGVPMGGGGNLQLGPQVPKDVVAAMKAHRCSGAPAVLQGMLMQCDSGGTVYLLKNPIATGGLDSAKAEQVGHSKLWFVEVAFGPDVTGVLAAAVKTMPGTELALTLKDQVLSGPIVDQSMADGTLGIVGDYNEKQARALADRLSTD